MITIFDKSYEEQRQLKLSINCSCGKDSIATALVCLERGVPIHSIVRYDNGADWTCMETEWNRLKELYAGTETQFIVLHGTPLLEQIKQKHYYKINDTYNYGIVPCGIFNRFGTTEKITMLTNYAVENNLTPVVGIACDENRQLEYNKSYPLAELGFSEDNALDICYRYDFDWLEPTEYGFSIRMYDYCDRLSCKYCSFSSSKQLALIYVLFPSEWERLEQIQKISDVPFKEWSSIYNMPLRLSNEINSLRQLFDIECLG